MKLLEIFTKSDNTFEGQRPYEHTIVLVHRHWFILFRKMLGYLLVALIPLALYLLFITLPDFVYFQSIFFLLVSAFYLLWWYSLFYSITMYLLDTWIITNHRVIDSEQHGFFDRTVSELSLLKIQDVSTEINGPIATWLKFGNLEIQTAGAREKFLFKQIPNPLLIKDQLMKAHNDFVAEHPEGIEIHEEQGL
ncbi:MAG: PH domain-containing protein [Candidatus Pacebacteria bacterium]|nr:PH domain-containing protein [Candidatus Paceibacterota bacterium]